MNSPVFSLKSLTRGLAALALSSLALHAAAPDASTTTPAPDPKDMKGVQPTLREKDDSPFHVRAGLPMWLSAVSGDVGLRGRVTSVGYMSFGDIFAHLDYVIPGSVQVDYGKWGLLVEGQYVKLSEGLSTRDVLFSGGDLKMEQAFIDINFSYKVVDTDKFTLAPFIGTRIQYASLHTTLNSRFPIIPSIDANGDQAWADPILGLSLKYQIFKPLSLVAKADVGGFGAASHLTYQFFAGTETQLTRSLYLSTGYRYMSTDYTSGGFTYNMAYGGPQITFGVNF